MALACGVLRWTPAMFWPSTPHEFHAALEGYAESKGGKKDAMTKERLDELMLEYPD